MRSPQSSIPSCCKQRQGGRPRGLSGCLSTHQTSPSWTWRNSRRCRRWSCPTRTREANLSRCSSSNSRTVPPAAPAFGKVAGLLRRELTIDARARSEPSHIVHLVEHGRRGGLRRLAHPAHRPAHPYDQHERSEEGRMMLVGAWWPPRPIRPRIIRTPKRALPCASSGRVGRVVEAMLRRRLAAPATANP